MNWIVLSLVALFSFSAMVTLITVLARQGFALSFILLAISVVIGIFFFIQTFITTHFKFAITWGTLAILLIVGLLSAVGNLAQFQAAKDAPNPGLAFAIVGMQAAVVSIIAVLFLKDKLTVLQTAGIVLGVIAILLISLGSRTR